jgi:hypothetical protein
VTAAIPLSTRTLTRLADLIRQRRRDLRCRWRRLDAAGQALLVLAHLRNGDTFTRLAAGFGVGTSTAWRYVREGLKAASAYGRRADRPVSSGLVATPERAPSRLLAPAGFEDPQPAPRVCLATIWQPLRWSVRSSPRCPCGATDRVRLCAHQRFGEHLDHLAQQIRARRGQLLTLARFASVRGYALLRRPTQPGSGVKIGKDMSSRH